MSSNTIPSSYNNASIPVASGKKRKLNYDDDLNATASNVSTHPNTTYPLPGASTTTNIAIAFPNSSSSSSAASAAITPMANASSTSANFIAPHVYGPFKQSVTSAAAAAATVTNSQMQGWTPTDQSNIPVTDAEKMVIAKDVYDAMVNVQDVVIDPTKPRSATPFLKGQFDDAYIQFISHTIVERTVRLYANGCSRPKWADPTWDVTKNAEIMDKKRRGTASFPSSYRNLSFGERMDDIVDALTQSKILCQSVLQGRIEMEYELLLAPGLRLRSKVNSTKSNRGRGLRSHNQQLENKVLKAKVKNLEATQTSSASGLATTATATATDHPFTRAPKRQKVNETPVASRRRPHAPGTLTTTLGKGSYSAMTPNAYNAPPSHNNDPYTANPTAKLRGGDYSTMNLLATNTPPDLTLDNQLGDANGLDFNLSMPTAPATAPFQIRPESGDGNEYGNGYESGYGSRPATSNSIGVVEFGGFPTDDNGTSYLDFGSDGHTGGGDYTQMRPSTIATFNYVEVENISAQHGRTSYNHAGAEAVSLSRSHQTPHSLDGIPSSSFTNAFAGVSKFGDDVIFDPPGNGNGSWEDLSPATAGSTGGANQGFSDMRSYSTTSGLPTTEPLWELD